MLSVEGNCLWSDEGWPVDSKKSLRVAPPCGGGQATCLRGDIELYSVKDHSQAEKKRSPGRGANQDIILTRFNLRVTTSRTGAENGPN